MRLIRLLVLFSIAAACDSKKLAAIPPDLPDAGSEGGAAGEAGADSGSAGSGPGGDGGAGGEPSSLPSFHFEGTADVMVDPTGAGGDSGSGGEGGAGGAASLPVTRVECLFYGDIIEAVPNDEGGYSGLIAGEVFRRLWSDDSPLFEIQALIGGPGDFAVDSEGNIELHIAGDQPADAKPFWLELEALSGMEDSPGHYTGAWTCASFMIDEPNFRDVGPDVAGSWELGPGE